MGKRLVNISGGLGGNILRVIDIRFGECLMAVATDDLITPKEGRFEAGDRGIAVGTSFHRPLAIIDTRCLNYERDARRTQFYSRARCPCHFSLASGFGPGTASARWA